MPQITAYEKWQDKEAGSCNSLPAAIMNQLRKKSTQWAEKAKPPKQ